MKKSVYTLLQWTWGLPQTLIGSAVYLANRDKRHFDFNGACATVWDREDGLSLGKFIFVPRMGNPRRDGSIVVSKELTEQEFGHSIQSLILGPTYLFLVGLPSIIWASHPHFEKKRINTGKSYYSPIFEKTANSLSASAMRRKR